MSPALTQYPETLRSGLEWLGDVPRHWQRTTIRAITSLHNVRGRPDLPLLSVYREYGVIRKDSRSDNRNPAGKDLSTYKLVQVGDLVLNKMKTWQGSLGVSQHDGIVSPAYIVCRLQDGLNPLYIHYLLRSWPYIFEYNRLSYGVRLGQWDMRYEEFKGIPLFLPPREEQDAIVAVLERELAMIEPVVRGYRTLVGSALSVTERTAALLYQYRLGVVAELVTGKRDVRAVAKQLPPIDSVLAEGREGAPLEVAEEEDDELAGEPSRAD